MPRGSEALTNARREEIVDACAHLYETMSFKDITIREIGKVTSCTRTSIYNYFQTREEIFLALLQREYASWSEQLAAIARGSGPLTRDQLADAIARTLEDRRVMLRLISTNLNEIEENSRLERLVEFKRVYGQSFAEVQACLDLLEPAMDEQERDTFVMLLFPFIYGIYPYAAVTPKQREAMQQAGMEFRERSIYQIASEGIRRLLGSGE